MVKTRNIICSEYYKHKRELMDRKLSIKNIELNDLDNDLINSVFMDKAEVFKDAKLRYKFILPGVRLSLIQPTKVVKTLADYFALYNNLIFIELQNFNLWRNKKCLDNLSHFSEQQVKLVTQVLVLNAVAPDLGRDRQPPQRVRREGHQAAPAR
jgi:hypothetical protein